ncbi:hypothetical protein EBU71_02035 [bacterium]|nr:hypothetical protein [Candidatus Elulimicrobium humile]
MALDNLVVEKADTLLATAQGVTSFNKEDIGDSLIYYIHLDKNITLEGIIFIWGILDKLDWEIFRSNKCYIDVYSEMEHSHVVEFRVGGKKTYDYYTGVTNTTTRPPTKVIPLPQKAGSSTIPYARWSMPKPLSRDSRIGFSQKNRPSNPFEIKEFEKDQLELESFREPFTKREKADLDRIFHEIFLNDVSGPFDYDSDDYLFWNIVDFATSEKCSVEIEKFRGGVYILYISFRGGAKNGYTNADNRYFKCLGLERISAVLKNFFDWIPF